MSPYDVFMMMGFSADTARKMSEIGVGEYTEVAIHLDSLRTMNDVSGVESVTLSRRLIAKPGEIERHIFASVNEDEGEEDGAYPIAKIKADDDGIEVTTPDGGVLARFSWERWFWAWCQPKYRSTS